MTMCAFRHLHALILSVLSLSLPHGAVGQNCIGNDWSHDGRENVPDMLRNNDAICSPDEKTKLFFDGQRCRLTYRECDRNDNCKDYHPAGPTKNCVSSGMAILQKNGDIKIYSNGAAFWWNLSEENGVFGKSFKPPIRDYYNKSKMNMSNDGNIRITVDGTKNVQQLVWSYTSRTRTAGFECRGSTLSTPNERSAVFGGDSINRPDKVGYCTDDKRFGIFFDRDTCQLKLCRSTIGSENPCNKIYHVAPAKNSPCSNGRAELLQSGKIVIYRDQDSSSPTILSAAELPGDFYQQPNGYSSQLTVSSTSIEIQVRYNRGFSLYWRVTHKSPNVGFECQGSTLSTPNARDAVFGGDSTNRPNKVGYCTNDKRFGIFFDRETCQLKLCRTSIGSKNPCNEIYQIAPPAYQPPCYDGRAELHYDGNLAIYDRISTNPVWLLSQQGQFGSTFRPVTTFSSSAKLTVFSSSIMFSSSIITVVDQTEVWSSDSRERQDYVPSISDVHYVPSRIDVNYVPSTIDVRTMGCSDNDNEMMKLRNQTCQQHLRNKYNSNRRNACGDSINGQAVKNLCPKSCYTGVCNHMHPRNSCYDSPETAQFGISSCESEINNCFNYLGNGKNILVRDYCRYTCRVDMDCNLELL